MYLYLLTLHRDEPQESLDSIAQPLLPTSSTKPGIVRAIYDKLFATDNAPGIGTEIFGLRWIFHEDAVPAETVASALTQYYKTFFAEYTVSYGTGELPLSSCHIKCECISVPDAYTPEKFEEEHLGINTGHGALMFKSLGPNRGSITSPFQNVHDKLAKESGRQLFMAYLKAWAASQDAASAWVRSRNAPQRIALDSTAGGPLQGTDLRTAFNRTDEAEAVFPIYTRRSFLERETETKRTLAVDLAVNRKKNKPMAWYLEPCALTPFLGTQFCPEAVIVPIQNPLPKPDPAFPAVSHEKLATAWKEVGALMAPAIPSANQVEAQTVVAEINSVLGVKKSSQAKYLEELWRIFTTEYVTAKQSNSAFSTPPVKTPLPLFLVAWKLFAMRPKQSPLHTLDHFADTVVGLKELPVSWEKDINSEMLALWFNEHIGQLLPGNGMTTLYLTPLMNIHLSRVVKALYGKAIPMGAVLLGLFAPYEEFNDLDYTPVLEFFQGGTQSEASKRAWVAAFIRERLKTPAEGKSLGSAELYTSFKGWLETFSAKQDEFLAQFPITEFTRLMKAAGFEMTRRSRGMVYLNVAMASGDVWSKEEPEAAAEEQEAHAVEEKEAEAVRNTVTAANEDAANTTGDESHQIRLTHGKSPKDTLAEYIKQRDAVHKEQTKGILNRGVGTVNMSIEKLLEGLSPEPAYAPT